MNEQITDKALLKHFLRDDLLAFTIRAFHEINPGREYLDNWHMRAIVHHLEESAAGRLNRLIVTLPPRSLKSITISVAYVAWRLGRDPGQRFVCVSYSAELAELLSRQFRKVVTSSWYRFLFPKMKIQSDTKFELVTTKGGGRFATSIGGTLTGRGGDVIIIDDPMKASDAASESVRNSVIAWYRESLPSRLDLQSKGTIILAMQRLHEDDLAGFLLDQAQWPLLDLPAIAQADQVVPIGPNQTYHWKAGEILHPGLWTLEDLERLKREHGSQAFSAVYLQRPVPSDGNMIKRKWLQTYDGALEYEDGDRIVQSWDTALKAGDHNDFSVCTTWLVKGDRFYLSNVYREKLEYHALRTRAIELANVQRADHVLIEDKGSGTSLIQDLQDAGAGVYPIPIEPEGDKITRMSTVTPLLENAQVFLPKEAPWLADFINELMAFPHSKHDDQVDSLSQFLRWVRDHLRHLPATDIRVTWG